MRPFRILVLACAAGALAGHAGAGDDPAQRVCFNRREVNAISALDDGHALAKLSASRYYLLTLDKSCQGLPHARQVALDRSRSRVCGDGTSLLSFEDLALGPMRCRIERIDVVADKNAALDLIASRAGSR